MEQMKDSLTVGLEAAWKDIATFLPKLVMFLLILLIGAFIARAIEKVLDTILHRLGFDKLVERSGVKTAMAKSGYDVSDVLCKLVYYATMLLVLVQAFHVFGQNPVSDLLAQAVAFVPNIFVAIVMIVLFAFLANFARDMVDVWLGGLSFGRVVAEATYVATLLVGAVAVLNQLHIAESIVNGLFYTVLAIIGGSAIVAIGGGGIVPMRAQWEKAINRLEKEAPAIQAQIENHDIEERAVVTTVPNTTVVK